MKIAPGGAAPPFPPYERGVVLLDHGAVLKWLQRRESNSLSPGYEQGGLPFALTAINDPSAGLAPAFCPLPTDRSAISAWME